MAPKLEFEVGVLDKLTAHVKQMNDTMSGFARNTERSFGQLTSGLMKAGAALGVFVAANKVKEFVQAGINYGDTVTDMARRTGLTVEKVQELSYVAKQSGTSIESLGMAFKQLNVKAYDNNKAFGLLGVSVKNNNGTLKDTGALFEEVLIKLAGVTGDTERAAIASKIFGKASTEVNGIVAEGADRIKELLDQTREYGLVLDKQTIKKLHEAKEAQELFKTATSVLSAEFASTFAPALTNATLAITKFLRALRGDDEATRLNKQLDELEARIKRAQSMGSKLVYIDPQLSLQPIAFAIKKLDELRVKKEKMDKAISGGGGGGTTPKDETSERAKNQREYFDAIEMYKKIQIDVDNDYRKTAQDNTDELLKNAKQRKDAQDDLTKKQIKSMKEVKELDEDQIRAKKREKQDALDAARTAVSSLEMVASKHREFIGIYKTAAIAQAMIDTYTSAVSSYKSLSVIPVIGPGLGFAAATAAIAMGLSNIQMIASQGFASGGWGQGMMRVGEQGPETIYMPSPAYVQSAGETRNDYSRTNQINVTIHDSSGNITERVRAQLRSGSGDQLVRDLQNKMARLI